MLELLPAKRASPDYPECPSSVPCPLPRRTGSGARVDCFPIPHGLPLLVEGSASATYRFEACSGFTRVTAHWIARPSKTAFVTGLRRSQLPSRTARQLPGQSTTPWMEPSSIDTPRLRGALPDPVECFPRPLSRIRTHPSSSRKCRSHYPGALQTPAPFTIPCQRSGTAHREPRTGRRGMDEPDLV